MRRLGVLLAVGICSLPVCAAEPAARQNGRLLVLGIAVNQFPVKKNKETFASYNYCAEEFTRIFREAGGPVFRGVETRLVLARNVTHARCLAELARLAQQARRQDVLALGIFAHGFTHAKEGWGIETVEKQTLWGHEIKAILGRLPCQALVIVETCTSGGFAVPHRKDVPLPPNVTALCACRQAQHTDNHLSIAYSEGLWGKADFDKDGLVDVAELVRYVQLRHKELNPKEKEKGGKDNELPVLVAAKTQARIPLTKASPDLVAVAVGNEWYQARLLKIDNGDKFHVHMLGWDSKPGSSYFLTDAVDRHHICLPDDPPPVKVEVNGKKRLALLVSKQGPQWNVRYLGGKMKDETVPSKQVQQLFGTETRVQKKRKKM
jgi:hypothetical protein